MHDPGAAAQKQPGRGRNRRTGWTYPHSGDKKGKSNTVSAIGITCHLRKRIVARQPMGAAPYTILAFGHRRLLILSAHLPTKNNHKAQAEMTDQCNEITTILEKTQAHVDDLH